MTQPFVLDAMEAENAPLRTDSQGPTTLIIAIFFGCLTFVVIALRLSARIFVTKHLGPDDCKSRVVFEQEQGLPVLDLIVIAAVS